MVSPPNRRLMNFFKNVLGIRIRSQKVKGKETIENKLVTCLFIY